MNKLRQVLAATDFSAPARHAAARAALVAGETGAALAVVHVASLDPLEKLRRLVSEMPLELEQNLLDGARAEMRELAEFLHRQRGIDAGTHVESGALLPEIIGKADTLSADLVVLGARGASFMRHLLLGSTAERMLRRLVRPMLVVKQTAHEKYRKLLAPVDFSAYSLRMLKHAQAVAPDAEIILLHVFEVPFEGKLRHAGVEESLIQHYQTVARQEAMQKLQALRDEAGLAPERTRLLVLHGNPLQHIIEQEQEQDCDLIVIGKHGESAAEELLLGSVTKHVLTESQGDVLVSV
jgi:nucleotide-binding universal stress UspA family protein